MLSRGAFLRSKGGWALSDRSIEDSGEWTATRAEALRRLDDFLPRAGRDYADSRNFDLGPPDRTNTSVLSPYLRHRLMTEQEVVAAAIGSHGLRGAEKFVG